MASSTLEKPLEDVGSESLGGGEVDRQLRQRHLQNTRDAAGDGSWRRDILTRQLSCHDSSAANALSYRMILQEAVQVVARIISKQPSCQLKLV